MAENVEPIGWRICWNAIGWQPYYGGQMPGFAIADAVAGVLQIPGDNTITIKSVGNNVTRITATVTNNGERTAVNLSLPT